MSKVKNYLKFRFLGHIIFWAISLAYWLNLFYMAGLGNFSLPLNTLLIGIILNSIFAISVYINLYILIPKFFIKKNYIFYSFWLIILMSASSLLIQVLFIYPFHFIFIEGQFNSFDPSIYSRYFFIILLYVVITSILKFIKEWFILQDLKFKYEQIEKQKLEAELTALKGQLNPHFLFNSLNNIYSLALNNSDKVPGLILKLSGLMRHIIYESRENFIPLKKELDFILSFIELQKIRIQNDKNIQFQIKGDIPEKRIAPLLFEPFIDNAFKHAQKDSSGKYFIQIVFDFNEKNLLAFSIENSYDNSTLSNKKHQGIGLENVNQRLLLLYDENDYSLDISKDNERFIVTMKLKLKD